MEIPEDKKEEISALMANVPCDKEYRCLESEVNQLCNAEFDAKLNAFKCMEDDSHPCRHKMFGFSGNQKYVKCGCPLRRILHMIING